MAMPLNTKGKLDYFLLEIVSVWYFGHTDIVSPYSNVVQGLLHIDIDWFSN